MKRVRIALASLCLLVLAVSREVSAQIITEIGRSARPLNIAVTDLANRSTRVITSGRSVDESPVRAPNGRHLAFASDRSGRSQIYTIDDDGTNLRQLTFEGRNSTPSWGPVPTP